MLAFCETCGGNVEPYGFSTRTKTVQFHCPHCEQIHVAPIEDGEHTGRLCPCGQQCSMQAQHCPRCGRPLRGRPGGETPATRAELTTEYYKLVDIVQAYDSQFLTIKAWSVTASSVVIGFWISRPSAWLAFIALAVLNGCFWIAEARHKRFQVSHTVRLSVVETALAEQRLIVGPRILGSYSDAAHARPPLFSRRSTVFRGQVMFPHVFFVAAGIVGAAVDAVVAR